MGKQPWFRGLMIKNDRQYISMPLFDVGQGGGDAINTETLQNQLPPEISPQ